MTSKIKQIMWFTADYFIDVDRQLVPYIRKEYQIKINWIIIQTIKGARVPQHNDYKILELHHRNKDPRTYIEVANFLKRIDLKNYDLIYSDSLGLMYYTALFNIVRHIPIIHAAHNVNPYPVWPFSLKMEVKYIFNRCQHFQMFSKHTASWFTKHYPKKSFFYAPMSIKDFGKVRTNNFNFDSSKLNLLFFGNVAANKRLDLLINAIKNLPEEVASKVCLNICGKCKEKDHFISLIGNAPNIVATFRRIEDEEIPELFTKSHFLMLPYEDVAQSGPHMIAYNYNLPVIASNIEGFTERIINNENGFTFNRNDLDSLINTIIKVSTLDKSAYEKIKRNLQEYVNSNYKLDVIANSYIQYFSKII